MKIASWTHFSSDSRINSDKKCAFGNGNELVQEDAQCLLLYTFANLSTGVAKFDFTMEPPSPSENLR